jgi:hypothetical protein
MKEPKAPRLVTIAIVTTTTIIFWVFFELYRVFTTTPPVNVPGELMKPIVPSLDISALDNVNGRIYLEEGEITEIVVGSPFTLPLPTPTATESAEVTEATESAEAITESPSPTPTLEELP